MNKRLLLDSHAFLFAASRPEELTPQTRRTIENEDTEVWVSVATLWELLLKASRGRLELGNDPETELRTYCEALRAKMLPVLAQHACHAVTLAGPHKNPYDYILIAQAQAEGLILVTRDAKRGKYGLETMW